MKTIYLTGVIKQFEYYRILGEKAMAQLPDEALFWQYNPESNSIAILVQHLVGNMLSRFTDFLTSDGEKIWRNRDVEFEGGLADRNELLAHWDEGWDRLLSTLNALSEEQLGEIVYIRNEGHTVLEAINRQLAHYPYHVGQIVYIAKMAMGDQWSSLSIPRNRSREYNDQKFSEKRTRRHFTDGL